MKQEHEAQTDLVDLGSATAETRGPGGIFLDEVLTTRPAGLSNG
ncbi:MAG TPA: benenodin family lasso peptide [Allosphingosinicella sp.]|jgi:hypothetical protein